MNIKEKGKERTRLKKPMTRNYNGYTKKKLKKKKRKREKSYVKGRGEKERKSLMMIF